MIPRLMRAVQVRQPGGPEELVLAEVPVPEPKAGEVLIRVSYAGLNRPDLMQRRGLYPPPPGASEILGLEVSGEVVAVGAGVSSGVLGDHVCALLTGGGYTEYCTAAATLCLPIPPGLDLLQAASLPETFFTVWANVFERGALQPGERLLVHGGSGGIGVAAIQLSRCHGAEVYATAGSGEKCAVIRSLGAHAINYRDEDFVERIRALTSGHGVDVILDIVGGDYLQRNLSCLAEDGRLLQIALQNGVRTDINLLPIMLRRLTLTGSTLRPRSVAEKARVAEALLTTAWPWLTNGQVKPLIDSVFELGDVAKAHGLMESGGHVGKVLLKVA